MNKITVLDNIAKIQKNLDNSNNNENILLLQGGGALGSYQCGAYEALHNNGFEPDWVMGISIGALNAAIIAGNPPEKRVAALKGFWETICKPTNFPTTVSFFGHWPRLTQILNISGRKLLNGFEASRAVLEGQNGFFKPRFPIPFAKGDIKQLSYYDTSELKNTLNKFVDFDLLNNGNVRVCVGAVNAETSELIYFDNTKQVLCAEHFMASGALPPSFPAVEINGQYYFDGGLVSNTLLPEVLKEVSSKNRLVFQIDLWDAQGELPHDFNQLSERIKDITYSSRETITSQQITQQHDQVQLLRELLNIIPDSEKNNEWVQQAQALCNTGETHTIKIIYKVKPYERNSKDYEFSLATMKEHWTSGIEDINASMGLDENCEKPSVYKTARMS